MIVKWKFANMDTVFETEIYDTFLTNLCSEKDKENFIKDCIYEDFKKEREYLCWEIIKSNCNITLEDSNQEDVASILEKSKDEFFYYNCINCRFFAPIATLSEGGHCARHAPTLDGYPIVNINNWCGDYSPGENPTKKEYLRKGLAKAAKL